jgi:KRAB domain-containing zinc finger protein
MQTHFTDKKFVCNIDDCKKAFKTYNSYYAHKRKHQVKNSAKYNCASCDKVFTSHSVLLTHVKSHTGETFTCHYEGCTKAYTHKQNLNMHLLTVHTQSGKVFKCEQCSKTLSNSNALRIHLAKVHNAAKTKICDSCDLKFASDQLLNVHKKQVHQPKAFNCEFCNYSANYSADLTKHIEKCHQEKEGDGEKKK